MAQALAGLIEPSSPVHHAQCLTRNRVRLKLSLLGVTARAAGFTCRLLGRSPSAVPASQTAADLIEIESPTWATGSAVRVAAGADGRTNRPVIHGPLPAKDAMSEAWRN